MTDRVKKLLKDFKSTYGSLYGKNFLLEINLSSSPVKVIVMTDKLAVQFRASLGNDTEIEVTSLDKDNSIGKYYRIKDRLLGKLYHYYRDKKEWERLIEDLPPSMITTTTTPSGDHVVVAELMAGEVFRGLETFYNPGWLAVAVCHDFEAHASKQLGWVKIDDTIEKIPERKMTRPQQLMNLDEAILKYVNVPYHLGGKSKQTGFDCSSLVQQIIFETKGIWLPKLARWQSLIGDNIAKEDAVKGDLVFFEEVPNWHVEHVGILIENTKPLPTIFHVSRHNGKAITENLGAAKWLTEKYRVSGYRRINN